MTARYEYNKRWRKKYPEKRRPERAKYYKNRATHTKNTRKRWTEEEDLLITAVNKLSDTELSVILERTVRAIQVRRCLLRAKVD